MADESKRHFWMKLTDDFLFGPEMKYILQQKNGCAYALLYEMICSRFKATNGKLIDLMHNIYVKYDAERLAVEFAQYFDHDTVILATILFEQIGFIARDVDGVMYIPEYGTLIGSESAAAIKKRRQRALKKARELQALQSGETLKSTPQKTGGQTGGQCPDDVHQSVSSNNKVSIDGGQCPDNVLPHNITSHNITSHNNKEAIDNSQSDGQDTPACSRDAELEFYKTNLHEHIDEMYGSECNSSVNQFHNFTDMIADAKIMSINSVPHKAAEILDTLQFYCTPTGKDEFYKVISFIQQKSAQGEVANEFNYTIAALYNNARNHGAISNVGRL